ncbi:MFS transporter [Bdellovibrio bacteriovorus]|uniref:MFS transporter n=1 Tax=Bdellovibrio bacteriovorus TaxID=959 RepID=A0A150WSW1_BDEBC|nr:MFS transporter [Bdellovibrio bacteriovorus]KYG67369.1 MFS transporter [Bdellovibrio bacteriovorus]
MEATIPSPSTGFTGYQKFIIAILAFLQFTIILDFMILSPLGAILMPALKVTTMQFGAVVSGYAISAGLSGFLTAGFADRFDRKKLLLFFYGGFILGTFLCGIAPNYEFLLGARIVTGLFGGVIGSIVFAILTDLFPMHQRGRVMGFLQTAFAASQVLGLPAGLYLSNHWGWHMPFMMIVVISLIAGVFIVLYMKPINAHLALQTDKKAYQHLLHTIQVPKYLLAFAATALLSIGGFMIMPFSSAFTVNNLGIHQDQLPIIYLITGIASILIGPLVGKASDSLGKFNVFIFGSLVSMVMVMVYTHLGVTPLVVVILVNTVMFVGIFSRMIPSQALMSAIPTPANRGAFMSISSSLQSLAGGLGSIIAGLIVVQEADGMIRHFETIGYVMVGLSLFTLVMMYMINRMVQNENR